MIDEWVALNKKIDQVRLTSNATKLFELNARLIEIENHMPAPKINSGIRHLKILNGLYWIWVGTLGANYIYNLSGAYSLHNGDANIFDIQNATSMNQISMKLSIDNPLINELRTQTLQLCHQTTFLPPKDLQGIMSEVIQYPNEFLDTIQIKKSPILKN